jgi:hypothetical protein
MVAGQICACDDCSKIACINGMPPAMVTTRSKNATKAKPSEEEPAPPARKVKNKVTVRSPPGKKPKPATSREVEAEDIPSSDEFVYSDHEDLSAAPKQGNEGWESETSQGTKDPLDPLVVKTLLIDIQRSGGIQAFRLQSHQALRHLCDKKPTIYGPRGDSRRKKIRKKVDRWTKASELDWQAILVKHSITEPAASKTGRTTPAPRAPRTTPREASETDSDSETESFTAKKPAPPAPRSIPNIVGPIATQVLPQVQAYDSHYTMSSSVKKKPSELPPYLQPDKFPKNTRK